MKTTTYGVIGSNGKLGRILSERPNFVPIECDVTDIDSIRKSYAPVDILVNCAGITSIDECELHPKHATAVNVRGVHNLHAVYGSRVLTISSDHVFNGKGWGILLPHEGSLTFAVNHYGWTKIGAEGVSKINRGKVIRLSRTVSLDDHDIGLWIRKMGLGKVIGVPSFFHRSYLTRSQAVDGIEYFVRNYNKMPQIVGYGSIEVTSMYRFVQQLAHRFGLDSHLVTEISEYDDKLVPRPLRGGFSTKLAKRLGFPIYRAIDVIEELWNAYTA